MKKNPSEKLCHCSSAYLEVWEQQSHRYGNKHCQERKTEHKLGSYIMEGKIIDLELQWLIDEFTFWKKAGSIIEAHPFLSEESELEMLPEPEGSM